MLMLLPVEFALRFTRGVAVRCLTLAIWAITTTLIPAVCAVETIRFLVLLTELFLILLSGRVPCTQAIVAYLFYWVKHVHIADEALIAISSLLMLLLVRRSVLRVKSISD
jgi:hypothetical protein